MEYFPEDVIIYIYRYLNYNDIGRICQVNDRLNGIGSSDNLLQLILPNNYRWIPNNNIKSYLNNYIVKDMQDFIYKILNKMRWNISLIVHLYITKNILCQLRLNVTRVKNIWKITILP